MVRFVALNAFIAVYTIIFCIWAVLLAFFGAKGNTIHSWVAVPWARSILWVCGIRVTAVGRENIEPEIPRIYMTNHQSYFDIFALLARLPVQFKFILKQELMGIPFLGVAMRRAGYIGIVREEPRQAVKSMRAAAEKIRNGASVLIFPEGTRSKDGLLQDFKRGGFNLALRSGCDIVPVTIRNSYKIVPKGSLKINRGSFDVHFGTPIPVKGYSKKNISGLMDLVRAAMLSRMEDEPGPHGPGQRSGPCGKDIRTRDDGPVTPSDEPGH